jgi:hypothetical protein
MSIGFCDPFYLFHETGHAFVFFVKVANPEIAASENFSETGKLHTFLKLSFAHVVIESQLIGCFYPQIIAQFLHTINFRFLPFFDFFPNDWIFRIRELWNWRVLCGVSKHCASEKTNISFSEKNRDGITGRYYKSRKACAAANISNLVIISSYRIVLPLLSHHYPIIILLSD